MVKAIYNNRKYYYYIKRYRSQIELRRNYSMMSSFENKSQLIHSKLSYIRGKINGLILRYEQLTGIDEIRAAQSKVIEAQDRFAAAQEKRRESNLELHAVKNKIKDLQDELSAIPRSDERYIVLITQEHKLLKEEVRLTDKFNLYEREEREHFATLTSVVKDSHERERIQANKTKYFSIIGSVMGTLIGIIGSSINNRSKISEIRKMVIERAEEGKQEITSFYKQVETFSNMLSNGSLETFTRDVTSKLCNVENICKDTKVNQEVIKDSLLQINENLDNIQYIVKKSNESDIRSNFGNYIIPSIVGLALYLVFKLST